MTLKEGYLQIKTKIQSVYDDGEAGNIARLLIENVTGIDRSNSFNNNEKEINPAHAIILQEYINRLLSNEPVQYILKEAWFYDLKFYVDKNVLIPRPETEELVDWVLKEVGNRGPGVNKVFDIGTGSGCIAIALKKHLPTETKVLACDTNEQILAIARKNAEVAEVSIDFTVLDFLDKKQRTQLPQFDIIISNPPYVPLKDKDTMKENVVNYEPHNALFVPNNDPLVFYTAIADFAKEKLNEGGTIYVELHENLGNRVVELFRSKGFPITELKIDMQGKDRMLKATR